MKSINNVIETYELVSYAQKILGIDDWNTVCRIMDEYRPELGESKYYLEKDELDYMKENNEQAYKVFKQLFEDEDVDELIIMND